MLTPYILLVKPISGLYSPISLGLVIHTIETGETGRNDLGHSLRLLRRERAGHLRGKVSGACDGRDCARLRLDQDVGPEMSGCASRTQLAAAGLQLLISKR